MLGRLKLSTADAKRHYDDVGECVFKHHRLLVRGKLKLIVPELNSNRMETALKAATIPNTTAVDYSRKTKAWVIDVAAGKVRMRDINQESSRT